MNQQKPSNISLRPVEDTDKPFLLELYGSTRAQELAQTPWPDEQKQQFITMQFNAQHSHYQEHYKGASFDIIAQQDESIGRLYLEEWPSQFRIIDIALLPQYCNQGIGSWFLKDIMQQSTAVEKAVSIHVEQNNPAMKLYQRLGFKKVSEQGIYHLMEWKEKLPNPAT